MKTFEKWTNYEYNDNTDLDWEINRYLKNSETFTKKDGTIFKINEIERKNLEKILNNNIGNEKEIAKNTSKENLEKLKSKMIISSATKDLRERINHIINIKEWKENKIEYNKEYIGEKEIIELFNKTAKWKDYIKLIKEKSNIEIKEVLKYIMISSKNFDVPIRSIISIMVWESDISIKKSPFNVNNKWSWQFLPPTFVWLYSTIKWAWKKWKRYTTQWDVLYYFKRNKYYKYYNNLKNIWITNLNDRINPKKSILAIWAYLKYISLVWKWVKWDFDKAVARYNIWPFWSIWSKRHLDNNPVIKEMYDKIFKEEKYPITPEKVFIASKQYYKQYS